LKDTNISFGVNKMKQEHYNTYHEGKSMSECNKCGSFLNSVNKCPNCS